MENETEGLSTNIYTDANCADFSSIKHGTGVEHSINALQALRNAAEEHQQNYNELNSNCSFTKISKNDLSKENENENPLLNNAKLVEKVVSVNTTDCEYYTVNTSVGAPLSQKSLHGNVILPHPLSFNVNNLEQMPSIPSSYVSANEESSCVTREMDLNKNSSSVADGNEILIPNTKNMDKEVSKTELVDSPVIKYLELDKISHMSDIGMNSSVLKERSIKNRDKPNLELILSNEFSKVLNENHKKIEQYAINLVFEVLNETLSQSVSMDWNIHCSGQCNQKLCREDYKKSLSLESKEKGRKALYSSLVIPDCGSSLRWTPETHSPSRHSYSRTSRRSSLSFSHDSLVGIIPNQDDSHLITGAVSHDALVFSNDKEHNIESENDSRNAYLNSDIYSLPLDVVKPYNGPILQPKVIIQQPKKAYPDCFVKANGEGQLKIEIYGKNHKKKRLSKYDRNQRTISKNLTSVENGQNIRSTQSNIEPLRSDVKDHTNSDSSLVDMQKITNCETHDAKELKSDSSRLCRIIPFNCSRSRKSKESTEVTEKKKTKSISSNIRHTLCTLFSSKKVHKDEDDSFVNARSEFINASHCLSESPNALKWGKICPLPSAPPLKNSMKNSAFTQHIKLVNPTMSSMATQNSSKKSNSPLTSSTLNSSIENGSLTQPKQSSSIKSTSLLSCLGHARNNSTEEQMCLPILEVDTTGSSCNKSPSDVNRRALPPLPLPLIGSEDSHMFDEDWKSTKISKFDEGCDFASIIEKVKNYGWYWGPISGEAAEKVLSNEPDGSFIVRDSSDHHYIFSLTFRLNGITRHVRIEHDQGNFSFGGFTRFKSQTIVDFIEKAVEHSRSGRYLFFLHRRPVLGPMRVQLLHPVSRFKHVQSLQHLCRFVIVKQVRKDLIHDLPLPQRLKDYLNSPHYYSEQVEQCMSSSKNSAGAERREKRRRNLHPNIRYTPQPSMRASFRNEFATLDSNAARSNPFSSSNRVSIPRTINYNFSIDPPVSLQSFNNSRCKTYRKSRELRRSSSHSSIESSIYQGTQRGPSKSRNKARRRSFHHTNRTSTPCDPQSLSLSSESRDASASDIDLSSNQ